MATRKQHNRRPGRSSSQLCRPTTRARIYARDHHRCVWCGQAAEHLSLDHLIPRSQGGSNRYWNLLTACRGCNSDRKDAPAMRFAQRFGVTASKRIALRILWAISLELPNRDRALELAA